MIIVLYLLCFIMNHDLEVYMLEYLADFTARHFVEL